MPQSEVKINPHKHSPSLLTELQFLVQPLFPDNACGADPRYTPEFDAIRLEIEKPSGADFQKVFLNCETLLMNHTRDMRVLGYYLLASAKVKGIGYFCQTLSAYYYIINSHWDALHPARPAARQNALKWLNQERIVSLLQQVDLLPQDLTFINDGYMAIKGINSIIQDIWPDETPSLGAIIKLIKTWVSQVPAGTIQEMTESDSGPEPITGPVPVVDEAATSDQITPKPEPSSELPPPAWVCEILTPLNGPFPCGSDPKYTPEYDIIKTEIEKPSNINFPLIAGNCQRVLTRHSKDIRVAGFYILALAKTQGAESFLWGLYSYSTLITTYLNDIYPQREMARINAIKWLNQDKLIQLTSPLPLEGVNIELIKATISKVAALSGYIVQNFNGQSPSMGNITRLLNTWLKQKEKSIPKPVESAVPTPAIAPHLFTPSASVNTVTSVNADPQNESDALALLRQGAGFLLDSAPQNPLGYKTTIALRWHTVTQLPPSVDQITKIAGPNSKRADFFEATYQTINIFNKPLNNVK
jgi:predicted component of type VI protein secretion system